MLLSVENSFARGVELELRCSYDLAPVPPHRRARREIYCSERCRRNARNWRRRAGRGGHAERPPRDRIIAGVCRVCGCTDDDCTGCVERTGSPCSWVEADLCSACVES